MLTAVDEEDLETLDGVERALELLPALAEELDPLLLLLFLEMEIEATFDKSFRSENGK